MLKTQSHLQNTIIQKQNPQEHTVLKQTDIKGLFTYGKYLSYHFGSFGKLKFVIRYKGQTYFSLSLNPLTLSGCNQNSD